MSPDEIRGKILDVLAKKERCTFAEIVRETGIPIHDLEIELTGLRKMNLIVKEGKYYSFPKGHRETEKVRRRYRDMIAVWYVY